LERGQSLFAQQQYAEAATELWKAVLFHGETPPEHTYDVQQVFQLFLQCYIQQGKLADGFAFVASESFRRGQIQMGHNYLQQALQIDPKNTLALQLQQQYDAQQQSQPKEQTSHNPDLKDKTPEQLYEMASAQFSIKEYEACADLFEISCQKSHKALAPSCANAVYCRTTIVDWGYNGTQFDRDMQRIEHIIQTETHLYRNNHTTTTKGSTWKRAMSVHPHMTLGYPIDPVYKKYVAESVAFLDETMARAAQGLGPNRRLPDLPPDLPFDYTTTWIQQQQSSSILRVGFVGSGFNSKAVLYLSQDMFRFFDTTQFEIHIFSFGPPDNPMFIQYGMRGVDWRKRVQANVHQFHDCQAMKLDHIQAARYIHDQHVHILIEWDGYARQGERAQGLFALRPAPVQILHQEYLGTSGAQYVDYLFTDTITSPPEHADALYTEKLIWMPNHFFSKGHAYQAEVKPPTYEYKPRRTATYELGTGTPQQNRCLAPGNSTVSFVYCNFNKLLKANPETVRSWIHILRQVPDSILCLLENPTVAIPYFRRFVYEAAGTSDSNGTFIPSPDGDDLNRRIHFLPWEKNPFDHQMRNQDFCNVMLDSHPYNGHTVAQDALYGGVPIVTRSDGLDMSSRVTTSANVVLGLTELNAYGGSSQYEDIAIRIGTDADFYQQIRTQLIDSCLQRNPMHPYWDVARYVKNFEEGLRQAWTLFREGKSPQHIHVVESEIAAKGTYDEEILAHPPEGKVHEKMGISSDEL
jgi:protein O-GlcNAc transferase